MYSRFNYTTVTITAGTTARAPIPKPIPTSTSAAEVKVNDDVVHYATAEIKEDGGNKMTTIILDSSVNYMIL